MIRQNRSQIISRRYIVHQAIGSGGMGTVYQATDRLTGHKVALKRVLVPGENLRFASYAGSSNPTLSMAQEFKVLASLRHPNIISVLDYGFDELRQPYFTMELLNQAKNLVEYGQDYPLEDQIRLLIQTLQALVYLHRRGILHRDLKPANVAVMPQNKVKVLDFGLSVVREQAAETPEVSGTLAYMAPEVLMLGRTSEQADIYAVGVMAYELLLGEHPFYKQDSSNLITDILYAEPDLSGLQMLPDLVPVLYRLLAKEPADRYASASEVIAALCRATGLPIPAETVAIRESFLQSARFVGRAAELEQLNTVLQQAADGQGSTWLVAGESGVGKSRLFEELRTLALVQGALVVSGQAISEHGSPYQLWQEAFRWLALSQPSDFEASVLKAVVNDIQNLTGQPVPDAPELDPQATQDRLLKVVEDIFRDIIEKEQGLLLLLVLEDVQWADTESLKILRRLIPLTQDKPFLILANYRDDEHPNLPALLPGAHVFKLERFSEQNITELSASMLGESGRKSQVVNLLQRETEGNVFFVVEVLRALAEEAGQLEDIGTITLPEKVFAGGMQQIIKRRLQQVQEKNLPLLEAAAVVGRQVDLTILKALALSLNLDQWLADCADAAVLDVREGNWRFAHDKLREGVLANLSAEKRQQLHRDIAQAIEKAYSGSSDHNVSLAYHWKNAGEPIKERYYAARAGEYALANGVNRDAIHYLSRAIDLYDAQTVTIQELATWERHLGEAYYGLGNMPESFTHLAQSVALLGYPVPAAGVSRLVNIVKEAGIQALYRLFPSRFIGQSRDQFLSLMEAARAYERIAEILYFRNHMFGTVYCGLATLNRAEAASQNAPEIMRAYSTNSVVINLLRLRGLARSYGQRARRMADVLDHPHALQWALMLEGMNYEIVGQWEKSEQVQLESIAAALSIGSGKRWSEATYQLACLKYYRGEFKASYALWQDIANAARKRGDNQALIWGLQGQLISSTPLTLEDESQSALAELDVDALMDWDTASLVNVYGGLAAVHLRRGEYDQSLTAVRKGLGLIQASLPTSYFTLSGYASIGEAAVKLWEAEINGLYAPKSEKPLQQHATEAVHAGRKFMLLFPISQPFGWRWQGLNYWLAGRHSRADYAWKRSLNDAITFKMPYEQALTHYEIGRHLSSASADRTRHLVAASELFEQLGADYDRQHAQQALETDFTP